MCENNIEKVEAVGFFEEDPKARSSMRLMCFMSLVFGMVLALITLLMADAAVVSAGVFLTTLFIVGAFAPKAIQKFAEMKMQ